MITTKRHFVSKKNNKFVLYTDLITKILYQIGFKIISNKAISEILHFCFLLNDIFVEIYIIHQSISLIFTNTQSFPTRICERDMRHDII